MVMLIGQCVFFSLLLFLCGACVCKAVGCGYLSLLAQSTVFVSYHLMRSAVDLWWPVAECVQIAICWSNARKKRTVIFSLSKFMDSKKKYTESHKESFIKNSHGHYEHASSKSASKRIEKYQRRSKSRDRAASNIKGKCFAFLLLYSPEE